MKVKLKSVLMPDEITHRLRAARLRRASARRHRQCLKCFNRRVLCNLCVKTYCVTCEPDHVNSHSVTSIAASSSQLIVAAPVNPLPSPPPNGNGTGKRSHKKKPTPTTFVVPTEYVELATILQKAGIHLLDWKDASLTVPFKQGDEADELIHKAGFSVPAFEANMLSKKTTITVRRK
jgi:hypothetical protein